MTGRIPQNNRRIPGKNDRSHNRKTFRYLKSKLHELHPLHIWSKPPRLLIYLDFAWFPSCYITVRQFSVRSNRRHYNVNTDLTWTTTVFPPGCSNANFMEMFECRTLQKGHFFPNNSIQFMLNFGEELKNYYSWLIHSWETKIFWIDKIRGPKFL